MAISSTSNRIAYTGNGVQTAFPFPYAYYDYTQLLVYVDGVLKTYGTYSVTPTSLNPEDGNPVGGTVTFVAAPANLSSIQIVRSLVLAQTVVLNDANNFPAKTIEKTFDQIVMMLQQHDEVLSRSLRADVTNTLDLTLPDVNTRKNKYLAFGSTGLPIAVDPASASGTSVLATGTTTARLLADRFDDAINAADFGATGNGSTDDTAAIQAALNAGFGTVRLTPGKTYIISYAGTWTPDALSERYCLAIPNNTTLDLNGATLKVANAANATAVAPLSTTSVQGNDIAVINGTIDCNKANQTDVTGSMSGVYMMNVLRPRVENVKFYNNRRFAARFLKCDRAVFNNLYCRESDGDGISFGIDTQWITNSFIDNIRSESCTGVWGGSSVGNGVNFCVQFCQVGKVYQKFCAGGLKIQDSTLSSSFGLLKAIGPTNGTTNSGVKIQGNGAGLTVKNVAIGQIVADNCYCQGLYLFDAQDISIACYNGRLNVNGSGSSQRDVDLNDKLDRISIGVINSTLCYGQGVVLGGSTSGAINLGLVHIIDSCQSAQVTAFQHGAPYSCNVECLNVVDNNNKLTNVFYVSTAAPFNIRKIITNLSVSTTKARLLTAAAAYDVWIHEFKCGGSGHLQGIQTLAASTSTSVTCDQAWRHYVGGAADYLQPIIQLTPMDGTTRALGTMYCVLNDDTSSSGFSIKHAAAAGTEKVIWKIIGWTVVPGTPT